MTSIADLPRLDPREELFLIGHDVFKSINAPGKLALLLAKCGGCQIMETGLIRRR
jgi:hypothetical protein